MKNKQQHKCSRQSCQNQTTNRSYCSNSCRAKHCLTGKLKSSFSGPRSKRGRIQQQEERLKLIQLGQWHKCDNPKCNNPSYNNTSISFCSPHCVAIYYTDVRKVGHTKYFRENKEIVSKKRKKYWADEDNRKSQSEKMIQWWKNPENKKYLLRRFANSYTKKRLETISRDRTLIAQQIISRSTKKIYASKKGLYKNSNLDVPYSNNIQYRNEYDLKAFHSLDKNSLVIKWIFLDFVIPYKSLKKEYDQHIAIDLDVYYKYNIRKLILIKPDGFEIEEYSLNIIKAIERYCLENKCEFEIWTKEILGIH